MSNYYIGIDQNGQVYLMHSYVGDKMKSAYGRAKGWTKKNAKYIQKVVENGKTRYFYDQKEWEAYVRGDKKKVTTLGGKIKDKLGVDERERADQAYKHLSTVERRKNIADFNKSFADQRVSNQSGISDKIGRTFSKKKRNEYEKRLEDQRKAQKGADDAAQAVEDARKALADRNREFMDTPLRKIEDLSDLPITISEYLDDTVDSIDHAITKISRDVEDIADDISRAKLKSDERKFESDLSKKMVKLGNKAYSEGKLKAKDKYVVYQGEMWDAEELIAELGIEAQEQYERYYSSDVESIRKKARKELFEIMNYIDKITV